MPDFTHTPPKLTPEDVTVPAVRAALSRYIVFGGDLQNTIRLYEAEILRLQKENAELSNGIRDNAIHLIDADTVMFRIDQQIQRGTLGSRTEIADARLSYSGPWEYVHFTKEQLEYRTKVTIAGEEPV